MAQLLCKHLPFSFSERGGFSLPSSTTPGPQHEPHILHCSHCLRRTLKSWVWASAIYLRLCVTVPFLTATLWTPLLHIPLADKMGGSKHPVPPASGMASCNSRLESWNLFLRHPHCKDSGQNEIPPCVLTEEGSEAGGQPLDLWAAHADKPGGGSLDTESMGGWASIPVSSYQLHEFRKQLNSRSFMNSSGFFTPGWPPKLCSWTQQF